MTYGVDQMIEVNIKESDDFLKIKETLTRISAHMLQMLITLHFEMINGLKTLLHLIDP